MKATAMRRQRRDSAKSAVVHAAVAWTHTPRPVEGLEPLAQAESCLVDAVLEFEMRKQRGWKEDDLHRP